MYNVKETIEVSIQEALKPDSDLVSAWAVALRALSSNTPSDKFFLLHTKVIQPTFAYTINCYVSNPTDGHCTCFVRLPDSDTLIIMQMHQYQQLIDLVATKYNTHTYFVGHCSLPSYKYLPMFQTVKDMSIQIFLALFD